MDNQYITTKMLLAHNLMVKNRFIIKDVLRLAKDSEVFNDPQLAVLIEALNESVLKVEEYLQRRCEAVSFVEKCSEDKPKP